jgi:DNA-directed RNA polymerase specialized sigma24 family protein
VAPAREEVVVEEHRPLVHSVNEPAFSGDDLARELKRLTGVAILLCRDPALAEDLAAEAITSVIGRTHAEEVDQLRPYLRRTLVNLIARHRRRKASEWLALVRGWTRPSDGDPSGGVTSRSEIGRALESLTFDQRVVIVLRYLEDMSPPQVAEALRIPIGTVESRSSRALAALRRALSEEVPDD